MTSIGDRLRQERLRRGLDVDQLARLTKISPSMLEAIEADDLEKLPGSFFTRSFVRQYARALGLNEDEFEPELKRVTGFEEPSTEEAEPEQHVVRPERIPSVMPSSGNHSLSAAIAFVLIVGACSGIYVLWQRVRETAKPASENTTVAREASPQPRPQAETPAPAAAPAPPPVQPSNEQAPPAEAAPSAEDIRIQVRASREEWIKVTADGGNVFAGILQPNESKTFDGKERVSIRFGNPGAVDVTWNGKPVADIGPAGQPRTVQFTREAYHVLSPAPPKPPAESDEP